MATTEPTKQNHEAVNPGPGEMGYGCKGCDTRFPTKKLADLHAIDQNLIEENEAKRAEALAGTPLAADPEVAPKAPELTPTPAPATPPAEEPTAATVQAPAKELVPQPPAPAAVGPSSLPLDLNHMSLNQINFIGQTMAKSGMFPDVKDASIALVKILAGQEIGVTPFQAMTNIHVIQGKATMGANLMAAKVKGSAKYDYRVVKLDNTVCTISFRQKNSVQVRLAADDQKLGEFTYTIEDAKRAGLVKPDSSWVKYPQNMLFARAISSGIYEDGDAAMAVAL
jgi:hypothetical protein